MQTTRPKTLVGVLGTHTEVGKTFVTSQWLTTLRTEGMRVSARKPAQSFNTSDITTDAKQLALATGEGATTVCPAHRCYPLALAPPMAADLLGRGRITTSELLTELNWHAGIELGVVETVGGPRSPLSHDGDSIDFLAQLKPDAVLLVADAGLGTLNAVRLSLECCESLHLPLPVAVFLNRYDANNELHCLNRTWLQAKYGVNSLTDVADIYPAIISGGTNTAT